MGNAPEWEAAQRGTPVGAKIELLKSYLRAERKLQGDYDRVDLLWAATEWPGLLEDAQKQELVAMILQASAGRWRMVDQDICDARASGAREIGRRS